LRSTRRVCLWVGRALITVCSCGGVAIADQEPEMVCAFVEVHEEVAGLLRHPVAGRVCGDFGHVHLPAL
jgi:hypothetical protein